jgi:glucokinase
MIMSASTLPLHLACDLGGTKVLLALYQGDSLYKQARYASQAYPSLEAIVSDFLSDIKDNILIKKAVFGIAGPVLERKSAQVTNLPWRLSAEALQAAFSLESCIFINDMEATALGILTLATEDIVPLYLPSEKTPGAIAVLGLGTGVGQTLLIAHGNRYLPAASEGGHRGFAPQNPLQQQYWHYLWQRLGHAPSAEAVLCGKGIGLAYDFLLTQNSHYQAIRFDDTDRNAQITEAALAGQPLAAATLAFYFDLLASESGNIALQYNALGGIYLAGGVMTRILPLLEKEAPRKRFIKTMQHKPPMQPWLAKMPVYAVKNPDTALAGARYFCFLDQ